MLSTTGIKDAISRLKLATSGPRKESVAAVCAAHFLARTSMGQDKGGVAWRNLLNPKIAMILFKAPPTSRRISVNVVARPVGSRGLSCLSSKALLLPLEDSRGARLVTTAGDPGRDSIEVVVCTTRLLMEAMAAVKVLPALALLAGSFFFVKAEAVESSERGKKDVRMNDRPITYASLGGGGGEGRKKTY